MTKEHTSEEIKYRLSDLGAQIGKIAINYITELEKENAELKEVHESDKRSLALIAKKGADFEKAYNEAEELLDKQIEATYKLFEENKELKEKLNFSTQYYRGEKAKEHLTKAKELLTRFVMASVYFNGKETDLIKEAEQFLKEGE